MQIKSEEPIRFRKMSTNHSKFVDGIMFPNPAPAKVVNTKYKDSTYISKKVGFKLKLSILYHPAVYLE